MLKTMEKSVPKTAPPRLNNVENLFLDYRKIHGAIFLSFVIRKH